MQTGIPECSLGGRSLESEVTCGANIFLVRPYIQSALQFMIYLKLIRCIKQRSSMDRVLKQPITFVTLYSVSKAHSQKTQEKNQMPYSLMGNFASVCYFFNPKNI